MPCCAVSRFECIDRLVQGLSALFLALRRRPIIRYQRSSSTAQRLAEGLYALTYKQQVCGSASSSSSSCKHAQLCLLDTCSNMNTTHASSIGSRVSAQGEQQDCRKASCQQRNNTTCACRLGCLTLAAAAVLWCCCWIATMTPSHPCSRSGPTRCVVPTATHWNSCSARHHLLCYCCLLTVQAESAHLHEPKLLPLNPSKSEFTASAVLPLVFRP